MDMKIFGGEEDKEIKIEMMRTEKQWHKVGIEAFEIKLQNLSESTETPNFPHTWEIDSLKTNLMLKDKMKNNLNKNP